MERKKEGDVVAVPFFCLSLISVSVSLSLSLSFSDFVDRSEDLGEKVRSSGAIEEWQLASNSLAARSSSFGLLLCIEHRRDPRYREAGP